MYGQRIRELRLERNMTQDQLAKELGVTQKNISKYELEQLDLNTETLIQICRLFDVSADYLLGQKDY